MRAQSSVFDPVSACAEWDQEQNPIIPNRTQRDHESSIINTQWPNHNEVQLVTQAAIKRFCRKRVAVTPLHTIVLYVSKHQSIVPSKLAPAPSWFRQFQCRKKSIFLQNNYNYQKNLKNRGQNKRNISMFFWCMVIAAKQAWTLVSVNQRNVLNR